MQLAQRMTADEYLALEERDRRTELVEGEVIVHEARVPHQLALRSILRALDGWALAAEGRGEVMLPLDTGLAELWLVDTVGEAIRVFRRSEPAVPTFDVVLELGVDEQLTSPQLPGFALAAASLFPG